MSQFWWLTPEQLCQNILAGKVVKAQVLATDLKESGHVAMDSEAWASIERASVWSTRSNLMGVPTDCPQRDVRTGTNCLLLFVATQICNAVSRSDWAGLLTLTLPQPRCFVVRFLSFSQLMRFCQIVRGWDAVSFYTSYARSIKATAQVQFTSEILVSNTIRSHPLGVGPRRQLHRFCAWCLLAFSFELQPTTHFFADCDPEDGETLIRCDRPWARPGDPSWRSNARPLLRANRFVSLAFFSGA
jgi:hypothetical protein